MHIHVHTHTHSLSHTHKHTGYGGYTTYGSFDHPYTHGPEAKLDVDALKPGVLPLYTSSICNNYLSTSYICNSYMYNSVALKLYV